MFRLRHDPEYRAEPKKVDIISHEEQVLYGQVSFLDVYNDLAIVETCCEGTKFTPATFGISKNVSVGNLVLAIGYSLGLSHTISKGIISSYDHFLQTDCSLHRGNGGGPLINMRGQVIGIVCHTCLIGPAMGFAIPSDAICEIVQKNNWMKKAEVKGQPIAEYGVTEPLTDPEWFGPI
ncbi:PREDICTED: putative protease Do-like 14 isoform X2 [Camelina sativa]|uniref:Protease Do-like 14 isoform X2 n=1 Tax=Camelina sativa TaxID=90675 RepID=A0ABM1R6V7_CAMSA|nr:PREDICTED: putative protease Do-like 14 isoform X2 [Camelina sativa]